MTTLYTNTVRLLKFPLIFMTFEISIPGDIPIMMVTLRVDIFQRAPFGAPWHTLPPFLCNDVVSVSKHAHMKKVSHQFFKIVTPQSELGPTGLEVPAPQLKIVQILISWEQIWHHFRIFLYRTNLICRRCNIKLIRSIKSKKNPSFSA